MNKELLIQVRDAIAASPGQLNMSSVFSCMNDSCEDAPNCGTAACVAGWTIAISRKQTPRDCRESLASKAVRENRLELAAGLLEITLRQQDALFFTGCSPMPFRHDFHTVRTQAEKAKIAVDRINHFLEHEQ